MDTVEITWDGEPLPAREGEPLAIALWRAGITTQTRSLKYHRPRGPYCLTGDCSRCMVRVDGVPNVRGCQTPAREGLELESQVGIPSAEHDVAAIVDRVFDRFDHERMFVKPAPVRAVYEYVARHMAGFGTQPTGEVAVTEGSRLTPEVLVAGTGPAGLAAAREIARAGREVLVVGDPMRPTALDVRVDPVTLDRFEADDGPALAEKLTTAIGEDARVHGAVLGLYEDTAHVLADTDEGWAVHAVDAETTIVAAGAYEGVARVEGNDLPGVFPARAARAMLDAWDTPPGERLAVIEPKRKGQAFLKRAREEGLNATVVAEPQRIEGKKRVERVVAEDRTVEADAAIVDPGPTPAPELGRQAQIPYTWEQALGGRVPLHRPDGSTPVPDAFVAGACAGVHTLEGQLLQGQAAGQAAIGSAPKDAAGRLRADAGLEDPEIEALERVWSP